MIPDGKMKIIDAAKKVIHQFGVQGATMRLVAEEAGVSTGAIYHYFASKEDILYAVMDLNLSESGRIAAYYGNGEVDKKGILKEVEEGIFRRLEKEDENRLQFYLAQEALSGNMALKSKFGDKYKEWHQAIDLLMRKLYDIDEVAGVKDCEFYRNMGAIMLASIDGIILQNMLGANDVPIENILKTYEFLLEEGIPKLKEIYGGAK
jgi:AcrR family transcriptional regulator